MASDYYRLLGVDRRAPTDVVKRAFRSRILRVHPDRNSLDELASEHTRELVEAYKVLANPRTRREYDTALAVSVRRAILPRRWHSPARSDHAARLMAGLGVLMFVMFAAFALVQAMTTEQAQEFRPEFAEPPYLPDVRSFPVVAEPCLSDCMEWYQTQQYQLSLANRWAAEQARKVYEEAARLAAQRGDIARVEFYLSAIDQASAVHGPLVF